MKLRPIGPKLGSTPGLQLEDELGARFYGKFYPDPDHARAEAAAMILYEQAGLWTTRPTLRVVDGRFGLVSEWIPGLAPFDDTIASRGQTFDLAAFLAVSLLVCNRDAMGTNLQANSAADRLVVVDAGSVMGWVGWRDTRGPFEGSRLMPREQAVADRLETRMPGILETGVKFLEGLDFDALRGLGFPPALLEDTIDTLCNRREKILAASR